MIKTKKTNTKSFQALMEKRLTKKEIVEIEQQAKLEAKLLKSLQEDISHAVNDYMDKKNIGFNELVSLLQISPTHIAKIKRCDANLTLASIARLFALLGKELHLVVKK